MNAVRVCLTQCLFVLCCLSEVVHTDEINMAFNDTIPPYIFPETDNGIEMDIIREALAFKGHTLKTRYVPLARMPIAFSEGEVDAVMSDFGQDLTTIGGFYAEPAVIFDNSLFSLKKRDFLIEKPEDIAGLRIISFFGADKRFPLWLAKPNEAGNFHETYKQKLQILTLFADRYDLVLSDRSIFYYFLSQLRKEGKITPQAISEHRVFVEKTRDYRPVFRNKKICDDFNEGLQQLKTSGRYQAIYDHYLN